MQYHINVSAATYVALVVFSGLDAYYYGKCVLVGDGVILYICWYSLVKVVGLLVRMAE